jgi:hypothetical protein
VERQNPKITNKVSPIIYTDSSDMALNAMIEEAVKIAQRRAKLLESMKQALLTDDMIALKQTAEVICGLRKEHIS